MCLLVGCRWAVSHDVIHIVRVGVARPNPGALIVPDGDTLASAIVASVFVLVAAVSVDRDGLAHSYSPTRALAQGLLAAPAAVRRQHEMVAAIRPVPLAKLVFGGRVVDDDQRRATYRPGRAGRRRS